jgi:1,4-alpha-glucan branching enzyme
MNAATPPKMKKHKQTISDIPVKEHATVFSEFDIGLFRAGKHYKLYKHLGAHSMTHQGVSGIQFSVWAPSANYVAVIGDFNNWDKESHQMRQRWDSSGIWELFVAGVTDGSLYKFHIGNANGYNMDKSDPFAFEAETAPSTASRIVLDKTFKWTDKRWLNKRAAQDFTEQPLSIYELHIGSWRRVPEQGNRFMTYRELAGYLPAYCLEMGFTHVELMPVMEHPFYGSWGYQITGYFAPSSRYGNAADFKYLINTLHKLNIGVILDWVPSHFPGDKHGLYEFDGSHLFEHADPKEGYHPDWSSYIFNYGRNEIRSFLISNAIFWLEEFHIDGLRVDAVASMLYRDYSRKQGEWVPNHLGGRENLEAIHFLQEFNEAVHTLQPDTFTIAEESTAFPGVTTAVAQGGLGFDFKWMMGWMHDTLSYFHKDPIYRNFDQHQVTFSMHYFYTEQFMLPLSHDEVVHGKQSLLQKMPGDDWQKAANLRLMFGYMFGHPGSKLLFMGDEFGQQQEWGHDFSLDWHLLQAPFHKGLQTLVKDLNHLYTTEPPLYKNNYNAKGFEWIDYNDTRNSVFCWLRKGDSPEDFLLCIMNATPQVLRDYKIGMPSSTALIELINTDAVQYGGSNVCNKEIIYPIEQSMHSQPYSISVTLPPLGLLIWKPQHKKVKKILPKK